MIKQARLARGMTLAKLAAATGIDQGLLSKYERGVVRPREQNMNAIFSALDLSPLAIVAGDEVPA